MKRWTALLLLLSWILAPARGQVRLAAIAGVHSAQVLENNNIPGWDTSSGRYYSPLTGFELGVLLEIPLGNHGFYFQPGLNYVSKGRQYSKFNDSATAAATDTVYSQGTLTLRYVEVPLYITYKLPLSANHKNSFFISAGPYFSFFYSGSLNLQNRIQSTNQFNTESDDLPVGNAPGKYKTVDMGINAKAGFELGNVLISGYFSRGLSNFYTATYEGSFHHQLFGASVGIWLAKSNPIPVTRSRKDTDHDGIPDDEDACPLVAGSALHHGCPAPDTDGDGIDDDHDSCRTVPGVARYNGCPVPDTDGDGIDDEHDSCKTVPGVARYNGCPVPDRDGDGVNDELDKCPDIPGPPENQGCPLPTALPDYSKIHVLFDLSSDRLTVDSYQVLDKLAEDLKSHPNLKLTIEGYTDNTGRPTDNHILSWRRAEAVRRYLVAKGVPAAQIRAIGNGTQNPAADNRSQAGRAVNRRVQFRISS
jgi:OOP family OmpA-OmpF porin